MSTSELLLSKCPISASEAAGAALSRVGPTQAERANRCVARSQRGLRWHLSKTHCRCQWARDGRLGAGRGRHPGAHPCGHGHRLRALPFTIQKSGAAIGTRRALNLIEGTNITLTVADDSGNDRVNAAVAAASGTTTHNLLSATHPDTVAAAPVMGDMIAANGTPAWARLARNNLDPEVPMADRDRHGVRSSDMGHALAGDLPAHTHAVSDVTSLATDLTLPGKGRRVGRSQDGDKSDAGLFVIMGVTACPAVESTTCRTER